MGETTTGRLERLRGRSGSFQGSVIDASTSLLAAQTHDVVSFAMGAPSGELVPGEQLRRCFQEAGDRLGYGATEGEPGLVETIVEQFRPHGLATSPERTLVTTGAMQGLDLAFKLLVEAGDLVVVEGPTYTNGNSTAIGYGARLLEAPVDEDGMIVERLPELVAETGQTPRAIYVVPTFQNPSGATMNLERRQRLLELAEQWDCWIIEDDPYRLLGFEGEAPPSFVELDRDGTRVFGVRTFSKVVAPGLRLGWIDAAPELRELAIRAKQAMDTCTSVPTQHAVEAFLRGGGLADHLAGLRRIYRQRRDAMREAIAAELGDAAVTTDPSGGMFLWVTLTGPYAGVDTEEMFPRALADGVAYIPGPAFSASGRFRDQLRVCFATSTPERIQEGVARLAGAIRREAA